MLHEAAYLLLQNNIWQNFLPQTAWISTDFVRNFGKISNKSFFNHKKIIYICSKTNVGTTIVIKKVILSRDIETNPEPQSKRCQEFSICHWNLNSIATHSFIKVSLLNAYITIYNYDFICLSETYLNSSILSDDNNLEIPRYDLIREDHPPSGKWGGVCTYYRNSLP